MQHTQQPTIIVIIGITGDLARRKLLPAIAQIARAKALPKAFHIIGITRRAVSSQDILADTPALTSAEDRQFIANHLSMHQMDIESAESYGALRTVLAKHSSEWTAPAQFLFYLSVPPQVSQPIVHHLGAAGFGELPDTKLLLEKPFGSDLASAEQLIDSTRQYFTESQLYRIDHYLAKEMAQDIIVFRTGNSLFKQTWNNQFIEKIDIIASEAIGIEGRAAFYEQTGALRDFIQSHLLQLAALTLMELPQSHDWGAIPDLRLAALAALKSPRADQFARHVIRGQYDTYAQEVSNPGTLTETFASITFESTAPQWQGVPITVATGKALDRKATEITIHYRRQAQEEANRLTLSIQPREGIEVLMWAKKPGYARDMEQLALQFTYHDHYQSLPEAYERVLVDAMRADHSLFTSSDEVRASWQLLAPIQHHWSMHTDDLITYPRGANPATIHNKQ